MEQIGLLLLASFLTRSRSAFQIESPDIRTAAIRQARGLFRLSVKSYAKGLGPVFRSLSNSHLDRRICIA